MLAIIIPYYKLTFFDETLQSLANQTDQRFRVYIGDDASPRDCIPLLKKYNGQFDLVYHRFENNLGGTSLTKQWERCIALSGDEEWLMILGDDDVLGDTVVEQFYKQYDIFKGKSNVVRYATIVLNEQNNSKSDKFIHPEFENGLDFFLRKLKGNTRSSLSEYIFSRKSFKKVGFKNYPLGWHSDDKAWIDFSDKSPIYSINNTIVTIRVSEFSLTGMIHNFDEKNEASILFFKDLLKENLHSFSKEQRLELMIEYEILFKKIRIVNFREWVFLAKMYINNFNLVSFLKFIRRFTISVLRS